MGLFQITEQRSLFIGIQSTQVTCQGISAGFSQAFTHSNPDCDFKKQNKNKPKNCKPNEKNSPTSLPPPKSQTTPHQHTTTPNTKKPTSQFKSKLNLCFTQRF